MSRTYYKYAERQADSQVNWSQIGKDLTSMLKTEQELRDKKREAIDEASRQFGQELENAPQGNSDDVNQWTTNYAADMQEYRLMTDRLLKSGQLKMRDYTLIRQNTLDGTRNLFNLSKEYQAEFEEKTKRRNEDVSSASEGQFMAMVEGFANLRETKALINPTTGAISVGRMERGPDGVMKLKEGPDNYMTVNQLKNRIKEKIDKYRVNEDLAGEVKLLGDVVQEVVTKTGSSLETGFMTKVTDPTLRKGLAQEGQQAVNTYLDVEKKILQAKLSNPRNVSSILFDWAGGVDPKTNKPYQVVTDPKLAATSSHYILWTYKDGLFQPDFDSNPNGKEQYKIAEDYLKVKLRGMLEQKTELDPFSQPRKDQPIPRQPSQWEYEETKAKEEAQSLGSTIAMFYKGDPAQQQSATNFFYGLPGVTNVQRNDSGVTITKDGVTKTIPFINQATGTRMSMNDFVRSAAPALVGSTRYLNEIIKGATGTGSGVFQSGTTSATAQSNNPNQMYADYISNSIGLNLIRKEEKDAKGAVKLVSVDEEDAVSNLKPVLSKLGFSVSSPIDPFGEFIVIKNKDGVKSGKINVKSDNAIEEIKSFLLGNVPGKNEEERIMYLSGLAKQGVLSGAKTANPTIQGGNVR